MATEAPLAELVARIKADTSQLDRALNELPTKAKQSTDKMGAAFSSLSRYATIGAGAISAMAVSIVNSAGKMNDLSLQTDFAIGSLGALDVILKQSGSSVDQLASVTAIMSTNISQAANGSKEMIEKFDRLGLSVSKLKDLGPEEAFYELTGALSGVENQIEQTELARAIFGRGAASLLPVIRETNGALREQVEALKEANPEYEASVKYLDGVGDAVSSAATSIQQKFTVALAEAALKAQILYVTLSEMFSSIDSSFNDSATGPADPNIAASIGGASAQSQAKAKGSNVGLIKDTTKAKKELTQAERDAARIIEMTRTPTEKYNIEMARANALLREGKITLDDYNRYQERMRDEMQKSNEKLQVFAINVKDYLGDAFESALFDAKSFSDGMGMILDGIARKIARQSFIDPLSDGLSGLINSAVGSFDFGGLFGGFRANGGPVSAGTSYVVGERGPEIFTPSVSGSITPNGAKGSISVTQVFHVSPGLQGAVEAEVRRAAPFIAAATKDAIYQDIDRGGTGSRLVGRRT